MADDSTNDAIVTGALLVSGGVAGYLGGRWFVEGRARHLRRSAPGSPAFSGMSPTAPPLPASVAAGRAPLAPRTVAAPTTAEPARVASSAQVDERIEPAPVSSPTEVDAELGGEPPRGGLPRHFDPILDRYRGETPIEYLRALAMRESGMNPAQRSGPAWGLLQIIEVVRADYNKAHRTHYTRTQLLDPAVNVAIATWLLGVIVESYRRNHTDVPNLRADWSNRRFVELLTFGWNAGWTEKGGVGAVARWLKRKGARDLDLDLVHAHARDAKASRHLSSAAKVRWCKGVVALYQRERGLVAQPVTTPSV